MPEHDETPNPVLVDNVTERAGLSKDTLARLRTRLVDLCGELIYAELTYAEGGRIPLIEMRPNHEPIDEFYLGRSYADRYKVQVDRIWEHWRESVERYGYLPRTTVDTDAVGRAYLILTAPANPIRLRDPRTDWQLTPDGWWRGWSVAPRRGTTPLPDPLADRIRAGIDRYTETHPDCP